MVYIAPELDMSQSPQRHFFFDKDTYEDNRLSIFLAVLLNFLNKPIVLRLAVRLVTSQGKLPQSECLYFLRTLEQQ